MNKILLGLAFILTGIVYGSLSLDDIYDATLGYLLEHQWINPPAKEKLSKSILGRKPTILLYSAILIIIGIYLIWNWNI